MENTRLILVGGFLGAGKTTLLWEAARRIMNKGKRVGLITNDQAPNLVDTAILLHNNIKVAEVSGSCFCCNFNGLINAMKHVRKDANADVILAEPVGSCTDLSATIIQPLKANMKHELFVSPLSVMADPFLLSAILNGETGGLHPSAAYILKKQLEESDIILISKTDLTAPSELVLLKEKTKLSFPGADVMTVSAITGEGIDEWLAEVIGRTDAGKHLAKVDYDIYAEGEAVLGWLNCNIELSGEQTDWDAFAQNLLHDLSQQFDKLEAPVAHVKIILENGSKFLTGNLTGRHHTLNVKGSAGKSAQARLTLNARVEISPEALQKIVSKTLDLQMNEKVAYKIWAMRSLSPGRPTPTYRYDHIVSIAR